MFALSFISYLGGANLLHRVHGVHRLHRLHRLHRVQAVPDTPRQFFTCAVSHCFVMRDIHCNLNKTVCICIVLVLSGLLVYFIIHAYIYDVSSRSFEL